jgi:hypothetical protein
MGASINLPVMLNQAPHVQKIQHAEQSHPETQQVFVGQEAVEKSKREQNKVPKADQSEGGLNVKKEKDGSGNQSFTGHGDHKRQHDEEDENEYAAGSGRIINLTV